MSGYRSASVLQDHESGQRLGLATGDGVGPQGRVENPTFFSGFVARPDIVAGGILAVADLAASRYADFGVTARINAADPVVTAGGEVLRFESFSACNGVYARLDLTREGLGSSEIGFGTTNVDVNVPLRHALARVGRGQTLHLGVGRDELRASTLGESYVERKVRLPERWVRGLAEVPALAAASREVGRVVGRGSVSRFLATLPRVEAWDADVGLLPLPNGLRVVPDGVPNSITVHGVGRLRSLDRVARHASSLQVHAHEHGATTWVVTVPGGRFTLSLSPGVYRGFSGEGTLLTLLSHPRAETAGIRLLALLGWDPFVNEEALVATSGLGPAEVRAGLGWLAAAGRLGYDVAAGQWFHRELPVDGEAIIRSAPRLERARRLLEKGAVTSGSGTANWSVRGTSETREVTVQERDGVRRARCTCPWETEHHGTRGPCAHVLAVVLMLREPPVSGA